MHFVLLHLLESLPCGQEYPYSDKVITYDVTSTCCAYFSVSYLINNSYCAMLQFPFLKYCPDSHPKSFNPNKCYSLMNTNISDCFHEIPFQASCSWSLQPFYKLRYIMAKVRQWQKINIWTTEKLSPHVTSVVGPINFLLFALHD